MSSTAMHRSTPSYQARSGRALEEHTRAMIVAAAERVMLDRIDAPPPGPPIELLTTAEVCSAARGYIRRDGTEGPIPKATMWKHFKSMAALAVAVVENLTANSRPVPAQIAALAAPTGPDSPRRDSVDATRLEARFSARHFDVARLEEQFNHASARNEQSDMLFWAAELAERHLQQRRRGDRNAMIAARDWARRGIGLVDATARLDCMMGIRCTRTAAAAEVALCRKLDYEPTGLSRIRSLKETEMAFADALGWPLHRELARFHADHARALSEEDPEREMRSLHRVAATVIELCGRTPVSAREPQDTLRATELADIIVGLRRMTMAYATHPDHHALYAAIFGADADATVDELLACFPATTRERHRHEGNIRALLRLGELTGPLDRIDPASDVLRTAEYGTIRDILVARYLEAKARSLASAEPHPEPGRTTGSLVDPQPAMLLQAAVQFYDHAATAASPRGATGILRDLAAHAGFELRRANPQGGAASTAATPPSSEFEAIAEAINDLVLITISRRNRFTDNEIERLIAMIDPMYYYITSGRN
ncbi:hypothetical protein [Nocardia huaxiensis]|uniref:hypothetical protein n=1 Tax=Nocardia huaxiensis TaxID=2755382 RepID=UPI001E363E30|nr:hypothetical protein [Nocardia huaxiensis]UFS98609.1 hypothetical protein LPY97_12275 [Nocardia huaxiensis]